LLTDSSSVGTSSRFQRFENCGFDISHNIGNLFFHRMNLTITDTWGYPRKDSPCYDGIVGVMECGDVEIGAIGLLQKVARWDRIDYAGETIDFG
jgi:hypothetical protein